MSALDEKLGDVSRSERASVPHSQRTPAALARLRANRQCADCSAACPLWASVSLGVFICERCAGLHRSLGTHITFVQSARIDAWKPEWVSRCAAVGNAVANAFYEAQLPKAEKAAVVKMWGADGGADGGGDRLGGSAPVVPMTAFLRAKYEEKRWRHETLEEPCKIHDRGGDVAAVYRKKRREKANERGSDRPGLTRVASVGVLPRFGLEGDDRDEGGEGGMRGDGGLGQRANGDFSTGPTTVAESPSLPGDWCRDVRSWSFADEGDGSTPAELCSSDVEKTRESGAPLFESGEARRLESEPHLSTGGVSTGAGHAGESQAPAHRSPSPIMSPCPSSCLTVPATHVSADTANTANLHANLQRIPEYFGSYTLDGMALATAGLTQASTGEPVSQESLTCETTPETKPVDEPGALAPGRRYGNRGAALKHRSGGHTSDGMECALGAYAKLCLRPQSVGIGREAFTEPFTEPFGEEFRVLSCVFRQKPVPEDACRASSASTPHPQQQPGSAFGGVVGGPGERTYAALEADLRTLQRRLNVDF